VRKRVLHRTKNRQRKTTSPDRKFDIYETVIMYSPKLTVLYKIREREFWFFTEQTTLLETRRMLMANLSNTVIMGRVAGGGKGGGVLRVEGR
jgi:hypothetical protein